MTLHTWSETYLDSNFLSSITSTTLQNTHLRCHLQMCVRLAFHAPQKFPHWLFSPSTAMGIKHTSCKTEIYCVQGSACLLWRLRVHQGCPIGAACWSASAGQCRSRPTSALTSCMLSMLDVPGTAVRTTSSPGSICVPLTLFMTTGMLCVLLQLSPRRMVVTSLIHKDTGGVLDAHEEKHY